MDHHSYRSPSELATPTNQIDGDRSRPSNLSHSGLTLLFTDPDYPISPSRNPSIRARLKQIAADPMDGGSTEPSGYELRNCHLSSDGTTVNLLAKSTQPTLLLTNFRRNRNVWIDG
ncbi:predicted protein [Arabidopsis lyrata subsp. lyrata]|uniref:Predicted protein n=1 Tax=Arabidopsis lyrata subsp. lyrata TaxID=81972 RepID=D7LIX3_ARALL|nr:predicted protein [Arabidopsis lyrata subsp. lyrata]